MAEVLVEYVWILAMDAKFWIIEKTLKFDPSSHL